MPGWLGKIGDFFSKDLFSVSIWNYAISFVILVVAVFAKSVTTRIVGKYLRKLVARTRFRLDDVLIEATVRPASWGVLLFGVYIALLPLGLTDKYGKFFGKAFETAVAVLVLVFLVRLVDGLAEYLKPKVAKTRTSLDDAILPAMRTAAKIFVLIVGILGILANLDYPIGSILAGLGVGGLAVALAAQQTLSNWFGAFMIFSDRPFTAGDRVVVGDVDGFIEQVGLRSTRIRTLEGTQVSIPNSTIANTEINNISRMPARKSNGTIGLTYETTADKMEEALGIIRDILRTNNSVREDFIVHFEDFADYSLNIRVIYWVLTVNYAEFLSIKEKVNLEIMRRFADAGIEMAFPTQTLYVKSE